MDTVTLIWQAVICVVFCLCCGVECCLPYLPDLVTIVGTPVNNLMVLCAIIHFYAGGDENWG